MRHEARHIAVPAARFDVPAKDKANAILRMRLEFPLNELDPDYFPLVLASQIFGAGGMESRLASRVRQQEGLSYGVGASLGVPRWGNDATLSIGGSFAPQNRDKVLALIDEELVKMATVGVSEAELARAKKDVLEGRLQGRADDGQLTATLSHLAERGEGWPAVAQREAQIRAVTLEQVNAAWVRHIKRETFVISTAGDF